MVLIMKRHMLLAVAAPVMVAGLSMGLGQGQPPQPKPGEVHRPLTPPAKPGSQAGAEVHHVPVLVVAQGMFSGPSPIETHDFAELKSLGVKTIISVDGARPEIELARAEGMRYVHIPVGYDGVTREQTLAIARAIRDLPGPVYVHCHHGKHRGPTAAATAAIALGRMNTDQALAFMEVAQTAPSYKGLWRCAREANVAELQELENAPAEFPEVAPVGDMVTAMVEIDERMEHLKEIEKAGWGVPKEHPDLVPVAEAARLADIYRALSELEATKTRHEDLPKLMMRAAIEAAALESMLAKPTVDSARASSIFESLTQDCKSCHKAHRD